MLKKYTNGSWSEVKYKKYGNKAEEFAEFPVTIKGDGNDLTDYSISGNMYQASGVSPTTPIQPQGTGERTGNLFDKTITDGIILRMYINQSGQQVSSQNYYISYPLKVEGNAVYTWNFNSEYGATHNAPTVAFYDNNNNQIGVATHNNSILHFTFTTPNNCAYIRASVYVGRTTNTSMLLEGGVSVQDQTVIPFIPYGIKIPISSAGQTTPVYLGEVQTTRMVKKYEFTGQETDLRMQAAITATNAIQLPTTLSDYKREPFICSHMEVTSNSGESSTHGFYGQLLTLCFALSMGLDTLEKVRTYLAQQYANGTPVTVWYVLATEETGIVNEPLRKIGDYADTLSMEQAGVSIPTLNGNTVIDVLTELKPSGMSLIYKAWSEANAKIYQNGAWTDTPTPPVTSVVYGWHVDPSIADSSDAVTYLEDAVGMTPAAMGASTFDYGSWENAFFMPKPCMVRSNGEVAYYLDPNDYSKKADGTPSDVANPDFDGNAMMEWGKIWYKFAGGETDGEGYFYVSNVQVDDSYHCWCNYDSKDNITDHFYTAIYNGTGTTKLRSISGVALTSANGNGDTTVTQEVARATANNTTADVEWYTDVWADRLLINALLVLIGKSLNTQATFGKGLDAGAQTAKEEYVTGTLNDKGLFWGVTADGNSAVKVFGMENWWGCVWRRTAGCISIDRALKIKLTYGTADGSTAAGYNQTGSGYISDNTIPSSSNYVKTMAYNQYGYAPNNVSDGSASTYYADHFYQNTGTRYLLVGGSSADGVSAGAFSFRLDSAPSRASWRLAASLSFKPLAE